MTEKKHKIYNVKDYIDYPKAQNSISKLLEKYPDGVSDEIIAKALNISEKEVEEIYQSAIEKIKAKLGV